MAGRIWSEEVAWKILENENENEVRETCMKVKNNSLSFVMLHERWRASGKPKKREEIPSMKLGRN